MTVTKFIVAFIGLLLINSRVCVPLADENSEYEQVARKYLKNAGLNIPAKGEGSEQWITLCTVKARVASTSWSTTHDVKRCTATVGGEILETRVAETEENWKCGWRNEVYTSNTLLNYKETINNQYETAIKAAVEAKEVKGVLDYLQKEQSLHVYNLEVATNKDTAMLEATATGDPFWGPGGSCAVKLEGRVLRLAY